jgi:hypothetical protein
MRERTGCFTAIWRIMMLRWFFDWLQGTFGWGRRNSCLGCGCIGLILGIIFWVVVAQIVFSTDWTRFSSLVHLWF